MVYKKILFERSEKNLLDTISSILLSPDGLSLVSASHDMSIKVWDIHQYKSQPTHHLENVHNGIIFYIRENSELNQFPSERIKSLDISSDSNFILSTGEKGSIKVSSIKDKLQVYQIPKNIKSNKKPYIPRILILIDKCAIFNKMKETSSIIIGAESHIDILNFETMQPPFYKRDLPSEDKERFESENILSANNQYILSFDLKYGDIKLFDSNTLRIIERLSHQIGI